MIRMIRLVSRDGYVLNSDAFTMDTYRLAIRSTLKFGIYNMNLIRDCIGYEYVDGTYIGTVRAITASDRVVVMFGMRWFNIASTTAYGS